MKKRLGDLPGAAFQARSVTIFRLPGWYHVNINKELCEPIMLAIGPYHHGKESLRTMEEHKWFTLRDFLARNKNVGFEVYLQAMRSIEAQARQCYSETVNMGSDDFVMMLLLDGCFILEWFKKLLNLDLYLKDTIFGVGWIGNYMLYDMLLLENQLPFFVIHKLFVLATRDQGVGWSQNCKDQCPLLQFFFEVLDGRPLGTFKPPKIPCSDIHHWLHLFYLGTVPDYQPQTQTDRSSKKGCSQRSKQRGVDSMDKNIHCVSELRDAGIKFKREKIGQLFGYIIQEGNN
jgi:Plant protein of unknown function